MTVLAVFFIAIGVFLNIYFVLSVIKSMASKNFMFTVVKEGTTKVVMTAGAGGAFDRLLMQYRGHKLNDDGTVGQTEEERELSKVKTRLGLKGIRWLGFPRFFEVYKYPFSWVSIEQKNDGTMGLKPHEKQIIDYILVQDDIYYTKVDKAEDKEMIPLNIGLAFRIRIINPYKALFAVQNWLEMTFNTLTPSFRKGVAGEKWEDIQKNPEDFTTQYMDSVEETINDLKGRYGIEVISVQMLTIDPSGEMVQKIRESSIKEFEARQDAKRKTIGADAEKYRIETVYGALADRGKLGELVRRLEALETAAQSGKLVFSAPELTEIARGLGVGKETAEDLAKRLTGKTPEEIIKEIEKYSKK
ncbi:MAG: SPFH domain-containing protein [bacterium]